MSNKALFLDRDGVINEVVKKYSNSAKEIIDDSPFNIAELKLRKGIKEVLLCAKSNGYKIIVVTNQPSILKGEFSLKNYEDITSEICKNLELERSQILECMHRVPYSLKCMCRKPANGLLMMAKGLFDIDLSSSIMVGDSWKDIQAANSCCLKESIFLKRKKSESEIGNEEDEVIMVEKGIKPTKIIESLNQIVKIIEEEK